MKKIFSKILIAVLCLTLTPLGFAGCKDDSHDPNMLVIDAFDGGYGVAWLKALGEKFEEKNDGIKVKIYPNYDDSVFNTQLTSGRSTADIVFERYAFWDRVYRPTVINGRVYESLLTDLTDIYTAPIPGEDVTIEEKLIDNVAEYYKTDGKFYHFNWAAGHMGILYNHKIWNKSWTLPRTTDELIALCQTIKTSSSKAPFVYSLKNTYWGIYSVWAAQYEGLQAIRDYDDGYDPNGNRYEPEFVLYKGFEEALKVLETLLKDSNGYMDSTSKELNFTDAQNKFLEGEAFMQPNGDWIEREMSVNFGKDETDVRFMRMPVISSIVNKCPSITGTYEEKQQKLAQIIDHIDNPANALPENVSEQDVQKIAQARSLQPITGQEHAAYIPVLSKKQELAKRFLQFMASDEGIETYVTASGGYRTLFEYDYQKPNLQESMSDFLKNSNQLVDTSYCFFLANKNPIFSLTGMQFMRNGMTGTVETYLSASNVNDYKSAETIYRENYTNLKNQWPNYLNTARIKK